MTASFADLTLDEFKKRNRISEEDWIAANITWDELRAIAEDHTQNFDTLSAAARYVAGVVQTFSKVHSVRWRVKDTEHLLEKIIRKRVEGTEKYLAISPQDYHSIITDLVGVRALHLFKEDYSDIDLQIRDAWDLEETAVIYIRAGDQPQEFDAGKFQSKEHPKGYRSIHYIVNTQPQKRKIQVELQVRTIFEEGWSEIDHKIRYPNFSENELIEYFLQTFNRISGSADEMGSFVKNLASELQQTQQKFDELGSARDSALSQVESTVEQMQEVKTQDAESQELIQKLKGEIKKLKAKISAADSITITDGNSHVKYDSRAIQPGTTGIVISTPSASNKTSIATFSDAIKKLYISDNNLGNIHITGGQVVFSPNRKDDDKKE
ncbi:hypothetical protein [Pseudomonas citronellolis]|uniref:hypothetical protein n=1 Tax=Pseudomonas citronellolis TaxID=53408 RepID=UPI0009F70C14|nr:hypothetical protein [Pseudomonas humi]